MAMPKSKSKPMIVDGQSYTVGISAGKFDSNEMVQIRLSIRSGFGHQSFCTVRGLINTWQYGGYGYNNSEKVKTISITPARLCEIIRLAHTRGWDPSNSKSNFEMVLSEMDFEAIESRV